MNTLTFAPSPLHMPLGLIDWVQSSSFVRSLRAVPTVSQTADELLSLADQYEATQPGYAADLRAAAGSVSFRCD